MIHEKVEGYKKTIDENYFGPFGLSFSKPIAETEFDLLRNSYETKMVRNIGPLLTDEV